MKKGFFKKIAIFAIFAFLIAAPGCQHFREPEPVETPRSELDRAGEKRAAPFSRAVTFSDCYRACCRVNVSGAAGSGAIYRIDGDKAYILTNCHVVGNNSAATLTFWPEGRQTAIPARVEWRSYDAAEPWDYGVITAPLESLRAIGPTYIPLEGEDGRPGVDSFILSAGAPRGRHVQAWAGRVIEYYQQRTAIFQPPPAPGQSGSCIISLVDGLPWISGTLTWLIGPEGSDASKGGAIPIANLYKAARGQRGTAAGVDAIPPGATECAGGDVLEVAPPQLEDGDLSTALDVAPNFREREPIREPYSEVAQLEAAADEWRAAQTSPTGFIDGALEKGADSFLAKRGGEIVGKVGNATAGAIKTAIYRLFWFFAFAGFVGTLSVEVFLTIIHQGVGLFRRQYRAAIERAAARYSEPPRPVEIKKPTQGGPTK